MSRAEMLRRRNNAAREYLAARKNYRGTDFDTTPTAIGLKARVGRWDRRLARR